MFDVEVHKFPKFGNEKTVKKIMLYSEFKKLKNDKFIYRAYQVGYNTTIL